MKRLCEDVGERVAEASPAWATNVYPRDFQILEPPGREAYRTITDLFVASAQLEKAGDLDSSELRDLKALQKLLGQAQSTMNKFMYQVAKLASK